MEIALILISANRYTGTTVSTTVKLVPILEYNAVLESDIRGIDLPV